MVKATLGDYLELSGELQKVIGMIEKDTVVVTQTVEDQKCPHCSGSLGKSHHYYVTGSPMFQENAKPIQTINVF